MQAQEEIHMGSTMRSTGYRLAALAAGAALLLSVVGCATAPEPDTEDTEAETETQTQDAEAEMPAPEEERSQAKNLRNTVRELELGDYAPDAFEQAEEQFQQAEAAYGSENERAAEAYRTAISHYETVLETGVEQRGQERAQAIRAARSKADEAKAPRAATETYEQAGSLVDQALQAREGENYREALRLSERAEEQYLQAFRQARQRRQQAQEALEALSEELEQAEQEIEGLRQEQEQFDPEAESSQASEGSS
jgi:hypothetical protein